LQLPQREYHNVSNQFNQADLKEWNAMKQIITHPVQMGSVVQSARKHRKISQVEVARLLGSSQPAVSRLEVHPENFKLADLLKVLHRLGLELTVSQRPQRADTNADTTTTSPKPQVW
jgi:predicted XRE-type DNA-binding protein